MYRVREQTLDNMAERFQNEKRMVKEAIESGRIQYERYMIEKAMEAGSVLVAAEYAEVKKKDENADG